MITQLQTPIPLETPKGHAWAVAIIDYGPQWDLQWVTFVHDSGECWTFRNSQVRQGENYTFGLDAPQPITQPIAKPIAKTAKLNGYKHNSNAIYAEQDHNETQNKPEFKFH